MSAGKGCHLHIHQSFFYRIMSSTHPSSFFIGSCHLHIHQVYMSMSTHPSSLQDHVFLHIHQVYRSMSIYTSIKFIGSCLSTHPSRLQHHVYLHIHQVFFIGPCLSTHPSSFLQEHVIYTSIKVFLQEHVYLHIHQVYRSISIYTSIKFIGACLSTHLSNLQEHVYLHIHQLYRSMSIYTSIQKHVIYNMKVIPMKFILSMIFIKQRLIIDIAYISNLYKLIFHIVLV